MSVFANFGSIKKVPILDQAINDDDEYYAVVESPVQENFTSIEVGTRASLMNNKMTVNAVYYNSTWNDRQANKYSQNAEGQSIVAQLEGLDQLHTGVEVEVAYQPMPLVRVDAALGLGNWTYTDDVKATYQDYDSGTKTTKEATIYLKDLHVGDSPQTQMALGITAFPMAGLTTRFLMKHNAELYSDFDPTTREDANDRTESWKLPNFTTFDLYASYKLNAGGYPLSLNLSVLNMTDLLYVNQAVDNSRFGGYHDDANGQTKAPKDRHTAQDAAVYFGMPMRMNLGVTVSF
jgi:outer membrane receptor protein involved in Fe transport